MNIVVAADKKYIKIFKDSLTKHNILDFESELKSNFVSRIAEHYNPHVLIVVGGVRSRKIDFFDTLPELRKQCPTMRIIYFFGRLTDETEQSYIDVCAKMFPCGYQGYQLHLFPRQSGNLFKIQSANDKRTLQGIPHK